MYIEPNSTIKIYKNVPLDNTYEHTIYFDSITAQNNYFHGTPSIVKHTLSSQTYQRVMKGSMRVSLKADDLYDCNYLAFQNTAFGVKWFYAFITGIEYVNNTTSEITFEIDDMQTYFFDVTLKECWVEREHSSTDVAGDNIVAEEIDIGDITCSDVSHTTLFENYVAVVATVQEIEGHTGGFKGGLFSGVNYIGAPINNATDIESLLEFLRATVEANKQDSVVSIFMMPQRFYTNETYPSTVDYPISKANTIHGYTPKNKKLLTYPYNYLSVDCGNNDAIYRYEWFATNSCNFVMIGTVSCDPQIALVPVNYNGSATEGNFVEKLVMKDFPQIAWGIDSFKAWLAQEASATAIQGIASVGAIAGGIATGSPLATGGGMIGLANTVNNVILATNRPNQARGVNSGAIDVATRTKDFYFRRMQVSLEYAKIIDDYFDMYGYATHKIKVPNRNIRPHWNYVKTNNCILIGNAPADSIRKICGIYNNGITFWKSASEVGNYSLNNRV